MDAQDSKGLRPIHYAARKDLTVGGFMGCCKWWCVCVGGDVEVMVPPSIPTDRRGIKKILNRIEPNQPPQQPPNSRWWRRWWGRARFTSSRGTRRATRRCTGRRGGL